MKTTEIFALCMVIMVVSFLGFVVENVWLAITKGYMDNRNMCLPFLLGYGLAIIAIYLLVGTPSKLVLFGKKLVIESRFLKTLIYFLLVMLCVSVGEVALGTIVEKTCGVIWWDYSRLPMHMTRYTSVPTSMGFSILITIFMQRFFEPLMERFMEMDLAKLRVLGIGGMLLLTADFLYNAARTYKNREMKPMWRIYVKGEKAHQFHR